jgi:hypothetical protein
MTSQIKQITDEATVENYFAEIKRLIAWLEYVPEHEFSEAERIKLISVSVKFAKIAQPIASKYLD